VVRRLLYSLEVFYELDDQDGRIGRITVGGVDIESFDAGVQEAIRDEIETYNLIEWEE